MGRGRIAGILVAVSSLAMVVGAAAPASAYGGGEGHFGVYQIGLSFNCNNPSACPDGLGGYWGWAEFDETTPPSGDAQFAGCGHTLGGGNAGAGHVSIEIDDWWIAPGSAGPQTFWASGTETDTFRGQRSSFQFSDDTGIPAVPGHYDAASIFGATPPPGVAVQVQVAYKPAH